MIKLELEVKKVGQTFTQIARTDKAAIYKSDWGHFEVFKIKIKKASEVFGKSYPEHEHYPSMEEFGVHAWCISDPKQAFKKYNEIS